MSGMSLTKDQQRVEIETSRAILREGKKFISLMLLDPTHNRIQGAIVLHATPYLDHATGMKKFHFEERGGPLQFTDDEMKGGSFCRMLDCEHNRQFLASMLGYKFWEIEDPEVLADIRMRSEKITKNAIIVKPNEPKETKMSDADIETEMARLQAEASRRKIQRADIGKRRPTPKIDNPINNTKAEDSGDSTVEQTTVGDTVPESSATNPLLPEEAATSPATRGKPAKRKKSSLVS